MDPEYRVSDKILADYLLMCANVTDDQQLMIVTSCGNEITVKKVEDALRRHHSKIQDREKKQRKEDRDHTTAFRSSPKPWKKPQTSNYQRPKHWTRRAFVAQETEDEEPNTDA